MLALIDSLTNLVEAELPALIYTAPCRDDVLKVGDKLLNLGFAELDDATILAAMRDLDLTAADEVTIPEPRHMGFSQQLFAVLAAAEAMPIALTQLDQLLSALCLSDFQLSLDGPELAVAARQAGYALRDDLAALDASF